jgi:hypothetical protein
MMVSRQFVDELSLLHSSVASVKKEHASYFSLEQTTTAMMDSADASKVGTGSADDVMLTSHRGSGDSESALASMESVQKKVGKSFNILHKITTVLARSTISPWYMESRFFIPEVGQRCESFLFLFVEATEECQSIKFIYTSVPCLS